MTLSRSVLLVLFFLTLVSGVSFCMDEPRAHASQSPWTPGEVSIARLCVAERGFDVDVFDCQAIAGVMQRRAERQGMRTYQYVTRHWTPRVMRSHRRYVRYLRPDFERPARWPSDMYWGDYRQAWATTLMQVHNALEAPLLCSPGQPDVWGGPRVDRHLIRERIRSGCRRVSCGRTANVFLEC